MCIDIRAEPHYSEYFTANGDNLKDIIYALLNKEHNENPYRYGTPGACAFLQERYLGIAKEGARGEDYCER